MRLHCHGGRGGEWSLEPHPPLGKMKQEPRERRLSHHAGVPVCKPRNDQRGCTPKEANCPLQLKRVCDVIKKDGTPCASMGHTMLKCPHA